ncbi:hypothetical protein M231_05210 [Tremella mesenterica]|uniref:Chromosome segregation in meiosis protein n=1 Tax=Tremella mesenterica TaxID=5217 RepID=A0A4Q1BIJ5_TREME|nr:hypothetical protein M231_05210 [Tremella mesenterica]
MATLEDLFGSPGGSPPPPILRDHSPSSPSNDQPLFLSPTSVISPRNHDYPNDSSSSHHSPSPINPRQKISHRRDQIVTREHSPKINTSHKHKRAGPEEDLFDDDDFLMDLPPPLPPVGQVFDPLAFDGAYVGGVGTTEKRGGDDDLDGGGKKRRIIPKIDAERLLGDKGIPGLMRVAKKFKPRGKGQEMADLRDLLGIYQMWAHGMFPKGDFAGTISRVEKVCHSRRMESAMKGFRESFYPPKHRTPSPPLGSSQQERPSSHSSPILRSNRQQSQIDEDQAQSDRAGSGNDEVPQEGRKEPLFDGPDMDELVAMEEMERESQDKRSGSKVVDDEPPVLEEEDEWEGLYD